MDGGNEPWKKYGMGPRGAHHVQKLLTRAAPSNWALWRAIKSGNLEVVHAGGEEQQTGKPHNLLWRCLERPFASR